MTDDGPLDPVLQSLLEGGKSIPPVPDVVRSRALARARATVATGVVRAIEPMPSQWRRALPIALAASIALAVGAAGAAATLLARSRASQNHVPVRPMRPALAPRLPTLALTPPTDAPDVARQDSLKAKPQRAGTSRQESYAAELRLLERAQAAYASRDFASALALVAEHGRLFPNGRLAEEREALRVRSLVGSGRMDEAARAAATFANRFPRSVLLPRLGIEPR